jgi:hypothetical protein
MKFVPCLKCGGRVGVKKGKSLPPRYCSKCRNEEARIRISDISQIREINTIGWLSVTPFQRNLRRAPFEYSHHVKKFLQDCGSAKH